MKYFFLTFLFLATYSNSYTQENFNIEVVANVSIDERANDVWGFAAADGTEYAIMGSLTKTTIWSLEDPANPIFRASFDGPSSIWRDIKSYEDHLYVATEREKEGILVLDMSLAPDTITATNYRPLIELDSVIDTLHTIHNIFIEEEDGLCYLAGSNIGNGGVLIFDLKTDKKEPSYVGAQDFNYAHDVYVRNNKMYSSDIYEGEFSIYNIEDKTAPVLLGSQTTIQEFSHNAWLSDDENYLFTTDERPNAWVESYDISDPSDIKFLDRYQPFETKNTDLIPHNVHYHNGFLVTSWNRDGLVILDAHKPDNLVKIAAYDTRTEEQTGGGLWGATPYLPSGLILGSDRDQGLFVFRILDNNGDEAYQRASYIEGVVTDANSGLEIPNVEMKIVSGENVEANTNALGFYSSGHALEGDYEVIFIKENYDTLRTSAVFESGEIYTLNAELVSTVSTKEIIDLLFTLSPNPIQDRMTVQLSQDYRSNAKLKIFAQSGKEVISTAIEKSQQTIDISQLSDGVYLARLETQDGYSKTLQFVKN